MTTIKDYLIIILAIIIMAMVLVKGCSKPFPNLEVVPQTIIKSDTVFSVDTLVKFKTIVKPEYDTIYEVDSIDSIDLDTLFYFREYNDSLSDSNLTIYSKVKVIGLLDKLDISYRNKIKPILITKHITETKIETKTPKISIYTGLELGGNKSSFNLSPFISFNFPKTSIGYRYGILNNTHSIGVGYKIFNSKK